MLPVCVDSFPSPAQEDLSRQLYNKYVSPVNKGFLAVRARLYATISARKNKRIDGGLV